MQPDLSVILVVGERRDRAVRALASVLSQEAVDRLEVLLLDLAPEEPGPLPGSDHRLHASRADQTGRYLATLPLVAAGHAASLAGEAAAYARRLRSR